MLMRSNIRELRQRQRRVRKLRAFKAKLAQTKDAKEREKIIEKIRRRSVNPLVDLADLK